MARLGLLLLAIWLIGSLAACAGSDQATQQAEPSDDVESSRSAARSERATRRAESRTAETTSTPANSQQPPNGKRAATPAQQSTVMPTTEVQPRVKPAAKDLARALLPGKAFSASIWEELLGTIPDTPETRRYIFLNDLDRVRKLFPSIPGDEANFTLPGPDTDEKTLNQWYGYIPPLGIEDDQVDRVPICGEFPFISGLGFWCYANVPPKRMFYKNLGFDVRNIKQTVVAGAPDQYLEILRGRFDPETTASVLGECSGCVPYNLVEHRGVSFYSWGEDYVVNIDRILAAPAFDSVGRGGRIAVQDDYLFRTTPTSGMEALIDTSQGHDPSLRDVEEFRLLAQSLDELGVYSAFMTDHKWELEETRQALLLNKDNSPEDLKKLLDHSPLLRPYQAWATGKGKDNNGHYMFLVLVHANPELATQNATLLPRRIIEATSVYYGYPWREDLLRSVDDAVKVGDRPPEEPRDAGMPTPMPTPTPTLDEYLSIGGMDVATDGRILIVKFRASIAVIRLIPYQALYHNDPILLYKQ